MPLVSTPTIDTPDYQRGVVSAQILLATVPAGTASTTVGIPPNCETLVLVIADATEPATNAVVRNVAGTVFFDGRAAIFPGGGGVAQTWFFDVSQSIVSQLLVGFLVAPTSTWYVYADAAAHLVVDAGKLLNKFGMQYVIPALPGTQSLDHPPFEALFTSAAPAATGALIAAPVGAGKRLRVFSATMGTPTAGVEGFLEDTVAGASFCCCAGPGNVSTTLPAQGIPFANNSALTYVLQAGAGTMLVTIVYTVETQ